MGIVNYDEKKINSFAETIEALDRKRKGLATKVVGGKLLSKTKGDEAVTAMAEVTEKMKKVTQEMWGNKPPIRIKVDDVVEVPEMKTLMPPMELGAFSVLKADIAKNGVLLPLIVSKFNNLIDGHQRLQACKDLGKGQESIPAYRIEMTDPKLMTQYAYKLNVLRRHLTDKQMKELVLKIKDHIVIKRGRPTKKMKDKNVMTATSIAKDIGKGSQTVRDWLKAPLITAPIPKERAGVTYESHHEEWKAKDYEADKDRPKNWIDRIVSSSNLGSTDKYQVKVTVIISRKST